MDAILNKVKAYLRMNENVTVYDDEIRGLIKSSMSSLTVAGVTDHTTDLATEYICTYVRKRMLRDASPQFLQFESDREMHIIQQLVYGGV